LVGGVIYIDADVRVESYGVGGPLMDSLGRVVGIAVRRRFEKTAYLVAADHILTLLEKVPPATPVRETGSR
jgi:hypothetical protein